VFYIKNAPNFFPVDRTRLTFLLHAYFSDTISPADTKELLDSISIVDQQELADIIDEVIPPDDLKDGWSLDRLSPVYSQILGDKRFIAAAPKKKISIKSYLSIAASLFILLSIGFSFYYFFNVNPSVNQNQTGARGPLVPGYDHAVLALANMDLIHLDTATEINLTYAGARIIQHHNRLDYSKINTDHATSAMNTLSTPRGGKFALVLDDGTKVWLNAASQLRYPSVFTGGSRLVELTGEAYFEVAKDSKRPFNVRVGSSMVQVLGTHFNISAYQDQPHMETTLLEGSVRLLNKGKSTLLKPGERAEVAQHDGAIAIRSVDVEEAIAWKKGLISFRDENISGIMKKISRWYDADVVFSKTPGKQLFGGTLNRNRPLSELLKNLEVLCDLKFKIEGRRIIVME
jgi:transmembrane sensor